MNKASENTIERHIIYINILVVDGNPAFDFLSSLGF